MAGHSKWANIRFRKGAQDAKRGKIFTKIIREITTATRLSGPDEATNPRLRDAVLKGLKANMKRDTIDNAIKRGTGDLDGDQMVEMRYEGYGPGGVAILVDCLSDNKQRTVSDVRHAFTKHQGNLGTDGSVAYLFTQQGEIILNALNVKEEEIIDLAITYGASDIVTESDFIEIITPVGHYHQILQALQTQKIIIEHAELTMRAQNQLTLDAEMSTNIIALIDALEDLDDVQMVYTNADIANI